MVKARKFILAKRFVGEAKVDDFELVEEELPPLKDGEILVEAVWLSVEPYMRGLADRYPLGTTMFGNQVARVLESRSPAHPVGKLIIGHIGWQEKAVVDVNMEDPLNVPKPAVLPDFQGHPDSLALGVLGLPGNTAYFGLEKTLQPKPGEVVVVTGAAGAVGSVAGQIARIKGCKVIGFAGTEEKVKWLTSELGFDHAFNYKTTDISEALKKSAPEGVDCYFDNVGGKITNTIFNHMRTNGRVFTCGSISNYNADGVKTHVEALKIPPSFVEKQIQIDSFMVTRWTDEWMDGINQMLQWVVEGKLKYRETITEGFENMPKALIEMMQGKNIGKAVVKV